MTAQQLRNSILQQAIQGRLVPQDPNDEPASVLLERIRKEKEQLVKEGKLKKKDLVIYSLPDNLPFDLPDTYISKKYINAVDKKIFDSKYSQEFISYSKNAVSNGYIVFEKEKGHAYRPIIPLK